MPSGAASEGRAPSIRSVCTDNGPALMIKRRACIETITEDVPVTSTPGVVLERYISSIGKATFPLDTKEPEDSDALLDDEDLKQELEDEEPEQGPVISTIRYEDNANETLHFNQSFTPVTLLVINAGEKEKCASWKHEDLMRPVYTGPGDGQCMLLRGTGAEPSKPPTLKIVQEGPMRQTGTGTIPAHQQALHKRAVHTSTVPQHIAVQGQGQTPCMVCQQALQPQNTTAAPVMTPACQASSTGQRAPAAAGYLIGAVPVDSPPKSLSKKGIKLDPPEPYNRSDKLHNLKQWAKTTTKCTYLVVTAWDWQWTGTTTQLNSHSTVDVAHEFHMLMQGRMTAQELYKELKLLFDQLPVPVDQFTFAQQYMSTLHVSIRCRVIMNGLSPAYDYHRIEVLMANAVDVEMSIQIALKTEHKHSVKPQKEVRHRADEQKPWAPPEKGRPETKSVPKIGNNNSKAAVLQPQPAAAPNCPNKRTVAAKAANTIVEQLLYKSNDSNSDIAEEPAQMEAEDKGESLNDKNKFTEYIDSNNDMQGSLPSNMD
ncbi:unnamed protein product [Rhizoctonia solani]|uniref:Uncharacterized protein n=1 Tax=Rhizoctonia solani TaxID=456999 RepID=A0A8H3BAX6_9AGAM|nr:unnamed protein product [Rhizoctonia solani]